MFTDLWPTRARHLISTCDQSEVKNKIESMVHDHRRNPQPNLNLNATGRRLENDDMSKSEQTFEVKMRSAYNIMQEGLEEIAKETIAYTGAVQDLLRQLEESQLRQRDSFHIMKDQGDQNKDKFESLCSTHPSFLDELAPWRMQIVKAGEEMIQDQSTQMRKSRKDMLDTAKRHLDEGREKQQLAADATEFIKHYKALMMAI